MRSRVLDASISLALALVLLTFFAGAASAATSTSISIELEEDGDSHWTVQSRVLLESDAEVEAFREVAGSNESVEQFRENMERIVADAANSTGREMSLTNFSSGVEVEGVTRTWGVTVYSFDWSGFAAREDGALSVSGLISQFNLAESDRLTVTGPAGWEVETVSPVPEVQRGGSVSWRGPQSFDVDEPELVFRRAAVATPTPGPDEALGWLPFVAAGVLLAAAALFALQRMRSGGEGEEELPLPDEDTVMRMVEEEGGRMRQAEVVERTGWSASKVSKVTGRLEEEGRLAKRRWGKEKILISQEDED